MGAEPGHHEHRRPSTSVPTAASGWRSRVRRSIARLVPQPGQKTSSHGVPVSSAERSVGGAATCGPAESRGGLKDLVRGRFHQECRREPSPRMGGPDAITQEVRHRSPLNDP
jgi:hypothetical protein